MVLKKSLLASLAMLSLIGIAASMNPGALPVSEEKTRARLQENPLQLRVDPLRQLLYTSCGEAAITMAYNYANLDSPIDEREVIDFARAQGYFTPQRLPFTSPQNMVEIARNYAGGVRSGVVVHPNQGLALLTYNLQEGEPVIIDVRARLYDPDSPAHFIVVTGMSVDAERGNALMIHYNDPLTGTRESARWAGNEGIWNAWQNNPDPGGSGWWMVIPPP